jgi:hypothetical protein
VLEQRGPGGFLEPLVQRAAQQRVGAVQLGPRREALEIPPCGQPLLVGAVSGH